MSGVKEVGTTFITLMQIWIGQMAQEEGGDESRLGSELRVKREGLGCFDGCCKVEGSHGLKSSERAS